MKVDFIIVGQGIAGTCFAFELLKKNKTFIIIDEVESSTSSRVALGVYNPLILKWLTKPWKIESQINYFFHFYNEINQFLKQDFTHDIGIYKFLKTPYEQNNWLSKSTQSNISQYMSSTLKNLNYKGLVNNECYGLVKFSGRLDVLKLLHSFASHFVKSENLINEKFNYHDLTIKDDCVLYRNILAKKIIFCEGVSAVSNPYFKSINLKPIKGEIITIYCKDLHLKSIIHSGFLLIPLGDDYYSVGATYDWDFNNTAPTKEAKQKIVNVLNKTIHLPYTIVNQYAGIRPSTSDRRALIGVHKDYNNMYILNGLGTRGVLLAPYLSKCLIESIYFKTLINSEVNINRFY